MLCLIASLSRLFSERSIPHIDYRIAENLFCKFYNAITKQKKKMKELFKLQDGRLPKEQIDKITTFWDKQLKAVYDKN